MMLKKSWVSRQCKFSWLRWWLTFDLIDKLTFENLCCALQAGAMDQKFTLSNVSHSDSASLKSFFWGGVLLSLPFFRSVQVSFSDLTFRWQPWFWCGVCISLLLYNVGIHCWHWWLTGHLTWLLLKEGLLFGNPSSRFWRKNVVLWSPLQFNLIPRKMVSDGSRSTSLH